MNVILSALTYIINIIMLIYNKQYSIDEINILMTVANKLN